MRARQRDCPRHGHPKTRWRARTALGAAFGEDRYSPSSVGIRYALSAAPGFSLRGRVRAQTLASTNHRPVASSAGRNVSIASSLAATSRGVPNVATVLNSRNVGAPTHSAIGSANMPLGPTASCTREHLRGLLVAHTILARRDELVASARTP